MDKYYTVEIPVEIRIKGSHSFDVEVSIGGYIDSDGKAYDMSFQSGFWIENYTSPSDFADLFIDGVEEKRTE